MARRRSGTPLGPLGIMGGVMYEAYAQALKPRSGQWVVKVVGVALGDVASMGLVQREFEQRVLMTGDLREREPFGHASNDVIEEILGEVGVALLRESIRKKSKREKLADEVLTSDSWHAWSRVVNRVLKR